VRKDLEPFFPAENEHAGENVHVAIDFNVGKHYADNKFREFNESLIEIILSQA